MISDAVQVKNNVADAPKFLVGGLYELSGIGTWSAGNVEVQQLALDGTTWIATGTKLTANGVATIYLAPGQYRLVVTTATGVYASLARVPLEC